MKKVLLTILLIGALTSCKNDKEPTTVKETEVKKDTVDLSIKEPNIEHSPEKRSKSVAELKAELISKGYKVFDYVDEKTKDTPLMQQYFIAFLKNGPIRNQNEEEANQLQSEHLAHLGKMYELGYADISGPFGDDGEIRGITIYNVPTLKMADSLANADPMVKAGRLVIEMHPWWAAKGFPLR